MSQISKMEPGAAVRAAADVSTEEVLQQTTMAELQLDVASVDKVEVKKNIGQITAQQAKKREWAAALDAARDLYRRGGVYGRASGTEYKEMLEVCKQAQHTKHFIPGSLLHFCKNHGIKIPPPDNNQGGSEVPWNEVMAVLEKMQAVNAVCDALGLDMPTAEDAVENLAQWDAVIVALQQQIDSLGADIAEGITQLQHAVGRYGSHVRDVSAAMSRLGQN